jgi:sugar/nucleoside kinase (ribokinase family)
MLTAGIGPVLLSHVIRIPYFPREDETVAIVGHDQVLGGAIPNRLLIQRQLGWSCRLLASIGEDGAATLISSSLQSAGIDITPLVRIPAGVSAFEHVWLSEASATRTIAYSAGSLGVLPATPFDHRFLDGVDVLQVEGREPHASRTASALARQRGIPVMCDLGNHPSPERLALIEGSTVAQISGRFARVHAPSKHPLEVARQLRADYQGRMVIVTDGVRGSWYSASGQEGHVPAFKVTATATLSAGDNFGAALTYTIVLGWPVAECMRFASAAAAMRCSGYPVAELSETIIQDFARRTPQHR